MVTFKQSAGALNQLPSDVVEQANNLYWHSGASVNRLARQLDLSKGALYEIIAPLPANLSCPHGDGELSYSNRTARERGFVSCAACGLEDEEERVRAHLEEEAHLSDPVVPAPSRKPGKLLVASVLAGVAAGLILGSLFRRR